MRTRLQIIFDEREMLEIRRTAKQQLPESDAARKIQVIRAAAKNSFPTADIDRMLAQIEAGCSAGVQPS